MPDLLESNDSEAYFAALIVSFPRGEREEVFFSAECGSPCSMADRICMISLRRAEDNSRGEKKSASCQNSILDHFSLIFLLIFPWRSWRLGGSLFEWDLRYNVDRQGQNQGRVNSYGSVADR
jgi:hypothetical protein